MNLSDPTERAYWRRHLSGLVAGRKVIGGIAPLAGLTDLVTHLVGAGAQKPLLVHSSRGAGRVPNEEEAHLVTVEVARYATMTEELRDHDRLLRELPSSVRQAIDAYDPERDALWCVGPFTSSEPVDGRTVAGGREPAWAALEDKIVADEIWDAVGFPRSERRVVEVSSPDILEAASHDLDLGSGVVWVADSRDGFNGGGEYTRWVATVEERQEALDFFKSRCDRVRVMPFLEGVPCSIHGIVLPDGTAAFRPVELAILRGEGRRFVYGGQGTTWDPPESDRAEMRELVRRTGALLSERVGYRGGFGIDGILTADGFRPTEINPRFSGGLTTLGRALDLSLFRLLQLNLSVGRDPGVTVDELEAWALPALDRRRLAQPKAVVDRPVAEEPLEIALSWDGVRLHRDPKGDLTLVVGPNPMGAFAKIDTRDALAVGDRIGPLNAAMMRFLDEEFDAGFGPVEPAPDVRTST
ncbi:MAG TPA: ATP-grasp domain-containing protein [Nocardioidaceae bacterium]|nr:ATP-grasp domain-containing protein [Nocardioidaceae bacterium]